MHVHHVVWLAIILFIILIVLGIVGFSLFFSANFVDSLFYTFLTMSGLSLEIKPVTDSQKLFVGFFAFVSIACYLLFVGVLIASLLNPIIEHALIGTVKD